MRKDHESSARGPLVRSHGLPHIDFDGAQQFITYRLRDSLPPGLRQRHSGTGATEDSLPFHTSPAPRRPNGLAIIVALDADLDRGFGRCVLKQQECAEIVADSLRYWHGQRYALDAWVVMPNHVHVLIRPFFGVELSTIVRTWKSRTAKRINQILGTSGPVWQSDYFDRYIRGDESSDRYVNYIHENPVKARLVGRAEDWPFSSAWKGEMRAAETTEENR